MMNTYMSITTEQWPSGDLLGEGPRWQTNVTVTDKVGVKGQRAQVVTDRVKKTNFTR